MDPRFLKLPRSLQRLSTTTTLNGVPALVAHPKGDEPVPAVIWMHGRTVYKELDPGRYQRWLRAGIGAVALDLPGHGARLDPAFHEPTKTLEVIEQGSNEIDGVLAEMREMGVFDMERIAIGGMSAGGMVTLHRLCRPHPFVAACVEGATGNLYDLYFPGEDGDGRPWPVTHDPNDVLRIDPMNHLEGFRPIPVLALHNEGDSVVPISTQRRFLRNLRAQYELVGADPAMIEFHTFTDTGAPSEHAGFGRMANDAKNLQVDFLSRAFGLHTDAD